MADVVPERVSWLWPGRIPFGKLTILDGDPGLGKSTVMLDLAARLSTGRALPGGGQHRPMGTILLMIEDGDADIIQPRLVNAGADLTMIGSLDTLVDEEGNECLPQIPDSIAAIENLVAVVDAGLVVIDPIMSYLGEGTNGHRDQDVRRALTPLVAFASRTGCAVVVLRHLNKMSGGEVKYRGQGSIGFIGIARSGLIVATDPDDPTRSVIASSKSNLGPPPPALAYRLENCENGMARVAWDGISQHTAQTLVAQPQSDEERSALDEAIDWLRDLLSEGAVFAKDAQRQAREAGIAERTLRRAREALHVHPKKARTAKNVSIWELPSAEETQELGQKENLANAPNPDLLDKLAKLDKLANHSDNNDSYIIGGISKTRENLANVSNLANLSNLAVLEGVAKFVGQVPLASASGRGFTCAICGGTTFAIEGQPLVCRSCRQGRAASAD